MKPNYYMMPTFMSSANVRSSAFSKASGKNSVLSSTIPVIFTVFILSCVCCFDSLDANPRSPW